MSKKNNQNASQAQNNNHENNTEKKMENQNMNQRGGEEYTSITGGPGLPGGYSNNDNKSGFEKTLEESNYEIMVSATGGSGGVPENVEEARKEYSFEDLVATLEDELPKITDESLLVTKIKGFCADYDEVFEKSNIMVASIAYVIGKHLMRLKGLRMANGMTNWQEHVKRTFPKLGKTARENRMTIASIPSVVNHLKFGVERLAEFGRYYNKLTEKDQKLLGDDPIAAILSKHDVDMTLPIEETRTKLDAVQAHLKLATQGVIVEPATLVKFLKAGHKITAADRKHMIAIAKEDENAPAMYLKDVIAAGGDRDDLLGDPTPDAEFVDKKIKNIDTQVVKLDGTLKKVLEDDNLKGKVDLDAIGELIEKLEKLRSTIRSHRS